MEGYHGDDYVVCIGIELERRVAPIGEHNPGWGSTSGSRDADWSFALGILMDQLIRYHYNFVLT
jgi:hypothetical protein